MTFQGPLSLDFYLVKVMSFLNYEAISYRCNLMMMEVEFKVNDTLSLINRDDQMFFIVLLISMFS